MAATRAPWVDVHAHPGRCFLAGLGGGDRLVGMLGAADVEAALSAARDAGLAAVTLSTVADLGVLAPDTVKGLRAVRDFGPGEAYADHRRQLTAIRQILDDVEVPVAVSAPDIERARASGHIVVLLACEGGDFLEDGLEALAETRSLGASSLTLVHYRVNQIGDVQTEEPVHGGLTGFGREVVAECNSLGVIIDCAHATLATTLGVLEVSGQPVMISHSHLDHASSHHPRLLSPAHARSVTDAGGLIGAWPSGATSTSLADFADEVVRLADLAGSGHVAIGTDMDANYRPVLASYAEFAALPELLAGRGLGGTDIDKILGGNALDLLRTVTAQL